MKKINILIAAAEASPFAKIGDLGDMTSSLARVLGNNKHVQVSVILPLYRSVREFPGLELSKTADISFSFNDVPQQIQIWTAVHEGVHYYFVEKDDFYNRESLYQYQSPEGPQLDYEDNLLRFAFFCRAVLEYCRKATPDIIHCYSWQTALIPVYLHAVYKEEKKYPHIKTVLSLPHMAFQGLFPSHMYHQTGLPDWVFSPQYLEYYGMFNLLKGGILTADRLVTISPSYADEIRSTALGCGLEGVLQEKSPLLTGILNGIDYREWDPSNDPHLYDIQYTAKKIARKKEIKELVLRDFGFSVGSDTPLFLFISRLESQKGMGLIEELRDFFQEANLMLIFCNSGSRHFTEFASRLAQNTPGKIVYYDASKDERALHRLVAAADILLQPSDQEPSGAHVQIACRYGVIPLVYKTGAPMDIVRDNENGFVFKEYTAEHLKNTIMRAIKAYEDTKQWQQMQLRSMSLNHSWEETVTPHVSLYSSLAAEK